MTEPTTEPQQAAPDNEQPDLIAVGLITRCVQKTLKIAPRVHWTEMWSVYQRTMAAVQESHPDRLPWQDPSEMDTVTVAGALSAVAAALRVVEDRDERDRLVHYVGGQIEAEQGRSGASPDGRVRGKAGKHPPRHCAYCGELFYPRTSRAVYCPAPAVCRQQAWKARQSAARSA